MRLLVVGGAGYIGSVVASRLLEDGHRVVVADNLDRGHRDAVPAEAEFYRVDLLDQPAVRDLLRGHFDGVLHFAALSLVGESVTEPVRYFRTNVTGTLNLLDAMREANVGRLVFSSTAAVYGEADEHPIDEDTPPKPGNAYGASKLAVDQAIAFECAASTLGAVSLRYFNVAGACGPYGERHEPETHLIPLVLQDRGGDPAVGPGLRDRLSHCGRHGGARLHSCRGSGPGPSPRTRINTRSRSSDLQPRKWHRLFSSPSSRSGWRGDGPGDLGGGQPQATGRSRRLGRVLRAGPS